MAQKILILATDILSMRADVKCWSAEDGDLIKKDKAISLSDDMRVPMYKTVCHAIADGWRLLAPPFVQKSTEHYTLYEWWLEKT